MKKYQNSKTTLQFSDIGESYVLTVLKNCAFKIKSFKIINSAESDKHPFALKNNQRI